MNVTQGLVLAWVEVHGGAAYYHRVPLHGPCCTNLPIMILGITALQELLLAACPLEIQLNLHQSTRHVKKQAQNLVRPTAWFKPG